jgi:hypothetical protein
MTSALKRYLAVAAQGSDHAASVRAAAEAVAGDAERVLAEAGPLARCQRAVAERDLGLDPAGFTCVPGIPGTILVPAGAPYPRSDRRGRQRRGAFDTPLAQARRLVASTLAATRRPVRSALDPAAGTGTFLVALLEAGVAGVVGIDLDPAALAVASIAAPQAELRLADGLELEPESVDLLVSNPPFVPPERQGTQWRKDIRRRLPWLQGRFDLAVPFAAISADAVRAGGAAGFVLPASVLSQPYGLPLRRAWLRGHRFHALGSPTQFPGAAVHVSEVVLEIGAEPGPIPPHGVLPSELLGLSNSPLDPALHPGDAALSATARGRSVPLGELALVDTGVVAHGPDGGKERLMRGEPGPGHVPYADARDFFMGKHRWLSWQPGRMHRSKRPSMFENPKIVVQRLRGRRPVRARICRDGIYVGHTCTIVQPHEPSLPLERLLALICSPIVDGLTRIERGARLDLYPRDVAAMPVPKSWLSGSDEPLWQALGLQPAGRDRLLTLSTQRLDPHGGTRG